MQIKIRAGETALTLDNLGPIKSDSGPYVTLRIEAPVPGDPMMYHDVIVNLNEHQLNELHDALGLIR